MPESTTRLTRVFALACPRLLCSRLAELGPPHEGITLQHDERIAAQKVAIIICNVILISGVILNNNTMRATKN